MKIITRNNILDFENKDLKAKEPEYHSFKKCSICGKPYIKNHTLPEEMINILGDKIRYIPSCTCHETLYERDLAEFDRKAREERIKNKVNKYKNFSIIDSRFLNSTFEKADLTGRHMEISLKYAESFTKSKGDAGILFYGNSGTGKTFAAACIGNYLTERGKTVIAINLGLYLGKLKVEWGKAENEILEKISLCDLLIIDDLGCEKISEWSLEKIFLLIDTRYRAEKPLIITTNLEYSRDNLKCAITKTFGTRIKDRISEMCFPICCTGESRRKSGTEKFMDFLSSSLINRK